MRAALAIAALVCACAALAQSQQPAPSQRLKGDPQKEQTDAAQKQAAPDSHGTPGAPLAGNVLPSPQADKEAAQKEAQSEDKSASDRWLVRANWAVFGAMVAQLLVFGLQAHRLKETVGEMKTATKTNEALVAVAKDTAARQLRAYVFAKGFTPGLSIWDDKIKDHLIFVTLENVGLTEATDVRCQLQFQTRSLGNAGEILFTPDSDSSPTVLGPRSTAQLQPLVIPLSMMMENWRESIEIAVWMRVEYRDAFDAAIIHHHEQAALIGCMHDPSDIPPKEHPSYIIFRTYGRQNSAS